MLKLLYKISLTIVLCGCSKDDNIQSPLNADVLPVTEGNWFRPVEETTWQWQLTGDINTSYDAEVYDIDLFDVSESTIGKLQAEGKKVIAYFSAGSYEQWRIDASSFSESDLGNPLDGWPGERWVDIRSPEIHSLMLNRLDLAKEKGFDGVEPDNVDGYSNNTGFDLTANDQLAYNRFMANEAHKRGLSIGLKNDLDQIPELVDYYDFSVNEECFEYEECDVLLPFITSGKAVFNAEYSSVLVNSSDARESLCAQANNLKLSTLILPLELDDTFRYSCRDL